MLVIEEKEITEEFVAAADALRMRWLNDGHELSEKWVREFRAARDRYDRARAQMASVQKG